MAAPTVQRRKIRQTGGGWVGGLVVWPCDLSFVNDKKAAAAKSGLTTAVAGTTKPATVIHLNMHAVESFEL